MTARHLPIRKALALFLFLLLLAVLLAACGEQAPVTTAEDSTLPHTAEKPSDTDKPPDTEAIPPLTGPEALESVMIHAVYGTGRLAAEAVIPYGYIQLYNQADTPVSLSGAALYYKTDGTKPYNQFPFPSDAVIPARGYYLVRAAGPADFLPENALMTLEHADADWGQIIDNKEVTLLLAPADKTFDPTAPPHTLSGVTSLFLASDTPSDSPFAVCDLSRFKVAVRTALKRDSGYHLVNLTKALTADLENLVTHTSDGRSNAVVRSALNEVLFSHTAGIYTEPISLTLTAKSGYRIYYTTDGSDPSDPRNTARREYNTSLSLADTSALPWGSLTKKWSLWHGLAKPLTNAFPGAYVIKAYATGPADSTPVYTNTYFIATQLAGYSIPVFSFSLPEEDMLGAEGFYNLYNPSGPRTRGLGVMEVFDEAGQRVGVSNVELAVSGNGSAGHAMKSLRIYYKGALNETGGMHADLDYDLFDGLAKDASGNPITTFDRLLLRNSGNDCGLSYIRDAYMQRVSADLSVSTLASRTVFLFINGEFWGIYNARERYSPEYVESHYGVNKDSVAILENDSSKVLTNPNAPYLVQSGEVGDAAPFNDLVAYMRDNDLSDPAAYAYVQSQMDIDSFIDLWVVRLYFNAVDFPGNNVKVFRNKDASDPSGMDTKWHFALLDLDMGLSFYDTTGVTDSHFSLINRGSVCGGMMCDLLENEDFKNRFILRYYQVVTQYFTPERLSAAFQEMYAERLPLMPLQEGRWYREGASTEIFREEGAKIAFFVRNRKVYALNALYRYFGINERYLLSLL